ncbi:MAG TPA: thioredoxin domain-containing protein [Stellaceae bacterium]|jgi:protein-disulfide isomerase|nr:thioredoxin domain-containing protein [Stellaceae bacterium]
MRQIWLILAAFLLSTALAESPAPAAAPAAAPAPSAQDHVLGKQDAPITIIEYGSLTCPHCAEFDTTTLPDVKKNWIDTGKAKLIFRIFPLNGLDVHAAMLASCVPSEHFFDFINAVYHDQASWMGAQDPEAALGGIARLAGVSEDKVKSCLADKAAQDAIISETFTAQKSYGVDSTPTFFINGAKMDPNGAQPYDVFNQQLTAALKG